MGGGYSKPRISFVLDWLCLLVGVLHPPLSKQLLAPHQKNLSHSTQSTTTPSIRVSHGLLFTTLWNLGGHSETSMINFQDITLLITGQFHRLSYPLLDKEHYERKVLLIR